MSVFLYLCNAIDNKNVIDILPVDLSFMCFGVSGVKYRSSIAVMARRRKSRVGPPLSIPGSRESDAEFVCWVEVFTGECP